MRNVKDFFSHNYSTLFIVMTIGAAVGLLASFVLANEAITLAQNSNAVLSCDLNAAVSCGAVGRHATAKVFGFPNAFIGLISFSVMLTVAVAGLMRATLPKFFMYLAWVGGVVGLIFAAWMFLTSVFVIGALCPWCLTTDVATLAVFWALTRYGVLENNLFLPKKLQKTAVHLVHKNYDTVIVLALAAIAVLIVIVNFGNQLFA